LLRTRTPMRPFYCDVRSRGRYVSEPNHRFPSRQVGDSCGRPKSVPMFAAEGAVRADSIGPTPTRKTRSPSDAVSPELALVDPDLARKLRANNPPLRPVVATVPVQASSVGTLRQELEPQRPEIEPMPRQPAPERGPRFRKLRVIGFVAMGALLTVLVRSEAPPAGAAAPTGTGAGVAAAPAGQTFVWAADPSAAAYEFQLFRGDARLYRARVTAPRLVLPGRWRQGSHSYGLTAASYRWYVWPISARTGSRGSVATVQAALVVARPRR